MRIGKTGIQARQVPSHTVPTLEHLENRLLMSGTWTGADWDGDQLTISLTGDGTLAVDTTGLSSAHRIKSVSVAGAESCSSDLTITVKKAGGGNGLVDIGRIFSPNANDGLDAMSGSQVNIVGDSGQGVNIQGHVASVTLNDVTGGGIYIAQPGIFYCQNLKSKITVNNVGAVPVQSSATLDSLTATSFAAGSSVTAPGINKITVSGNFLGNITNQRRDVGTVTVGGAVGGTWTGVRNLGAVKVGSSLATFVVNFPAGNVASFTTTATDMAFNTWTSLTLGSLTIKRHMLTGTMNLTQPFAAGKNNLGSANIGYWMTSATIRSAGNIGSVTALGMNAAKIFAGVQPGVSAPTGGTVPAGYFAAQATIASVTTKGVPGATPPDRHSTKGTNIFAWNIGKISLFGAEEVVSNLAFVECGGLTMTKPDGTKFSYPKNWTSEASDWVHVVDMVAPA